MDYELNAAKARQAALRAESGYVPAAKREPQETLRRLQARQLKERRAELRALRANLWPIAQRIMGAVSDCVPDGDPIDLLAPYVRRKLQLSEVEGWDITSWLDKACRKHLDCKSYNQYLIDAWDGWNEVCEPDQRIPNPWK